MLSDLGDLWGYSPFGSNACSFADTPQSSISARMYLPLAKWALRYTPTPSVAIIYIDPAHDPPDLLTNTCASRAFLARLIHGPQRAVRPSSSSSTRYYSANSCAEQDKTDALLAAVESSKVPIVVGQAKHALSIRHDFNRLPCAYRQARFQNPQGPLRPHTARQRTTSRFLFALAGLHRPGRHREQHAGSFSLRRPARLLLRRRCPPPVATHSRWSRPRLVNPNIESNPSLAKLLGAKPIRSTRTRRF
jgi:uncharacterized CHY-type Zn-finger protein